MNKPVLSIFIPTYNHEYNIAQALESVLAQETSYPIEIIVGDDYSTDNTRDILKEYECRFPDRLTVIYRDHNTYLEDNNNIVDLMKRCVGKYIIGLEGDDYWTDRKKIDKEITFLEQHPQYYAVAHNCVVVDNNSVPTGEEYKECKDAEYTYKHFFSNILPGQTTTLMYRNYFYDNNFHSDYPKTPNGSPSDKILDYMLLVNGRVFCIQETMSAYRHVVSSGSSYSATHQFDYNLEQALYKAMKEYTLSYKPEWVKYVKIVFMDTSLRGLKHKQISLRASIRMLIDERMITYIPLFICYLVRKYIFKTKFYI